jgi:hypothetical protein
MGFRQTLAFANNLPNPKKLIQNATLPTDRRLSIRTKCQSAITEIRLAEIRQLTTPLSELQALH